ncbi:hypothetical protein [Paenibacillus tengchongensis]|uniref:hypothetical protein n=1 Tax=Paenibacillus tengchongensis TaxID=2608684 RepID=UPI00124F4849|nr:hypothetical protein [Paenibacillus tengchongensis]
MSVIEKTIIVSTSFRNRQYYTDKGYNVEPGAKEIEVSVDDLPRGCEREVTPVCDACGKVGRKRKWCHVFRDRMHGKDFCSACMYDINVLVDHSDVESAGEKTVRYWLGKHRLDYRTQVRQKGVIGASGRPLLFDFAVLGQDGQPAAFIEYDGPHHYRPVTFSGQDPGKSAQEFAYQQEFDRRKDRHCARLGVTMVRIKYDVTTEEIGKIIGRLKEELEEAAIWKDVG